MKQRQLIMAIQRRVATVCVGPSTFRALPAGSLDCARKFLETLPLARFACTSDVQFGRALDRTTSALELVLPPRARSFGLSRKVLNLFLRDAVYNHHLRSCFGLGSALRWFEIPVDSVVAKELRLRVGRSVPIWPTFRGMSPEAHAAYQCAASGLARQLRIHRVHLDAFLWVEGR